MAEKSNLKRGDRYFTVSFMKHSNATQHVWSDDEYDRRLFDKGLVFEQETEASETANMMLGLM